VVSCTTSGGATDDPPRRRGVSRALGALRYGGIEK